MAVIRKFPAPSICTRIQAVSRKKELEEILRDLATAVSVDQACYLWENGVRSRNIFFAWGLPETWISLYKQRAYVHRDPFVIGHVSRDASTYLDVLGTGGERHRQMYREASRYGVARYVFFVPVGNTLRDNSFFLFGSRTSETDLRERIEPVRDDVEHLCAVLHAKIEELTRGDAVSWDFGLRNREREVLSMLARGYSRSEIADALEVSVHTVRDHMDRARQKMEARTIIETVARAVAAGEVIV